MLSKTYFTKTTVFQKVVRQLQVLGAYGYRGYYEKKAHFLATIPP